MADMTRRDACGVEQSGGEMCSGVIVVEEGGLGRRVAGGRAK